MDVATISTSDGYRPRNLTGIFSRSIHSWIRLRSIHSWTWRGLARCQRRGAAGGNSWRWRSSFSAELRGLIGCFLFLFCLSVSKSQGHFFRSFQKHSLQTFTAKASYFAEFHGQSRLFSYILFFVFS